MEGVDSEIQMLQEQYRAQIESACDQSEDGLVSAGDIRTNDGTFTLKIKCPPASTNEDLTPSQEEGEE